MTGGIRKPDPVWNRRNALGLGLALGCGACIGQAEAQTSPAPRVMRPQPGDLLVRVVGLSGAGEPLRPGDILQDAPQVLAFPLEPGSQTVRDGSRLNQILLLRLDPHSLDAETRGRSVDGIVAYSASCTHALCPVTEYRRDAGVLHCSCHNSEFDPRAGAKVVGGPAQRRLPPLALRLGEGDSLQVAQPFLGKVGAQTT